MSRGRGTRYSSGHCSSGSCQGSSSRSAGCSGLVALICKAMPRLPERPFPGPVRGVLHRPAVDGTVPRQQEVARQPGDDVERGGRARPVVVEEVGQQLRSSVRERACLAHQRVTGDHHPGVGGGGRRSGRRCARGAPARASPGRSSGTVRREGAGAVTARRVPPVRSTCTAHGRTPGRQALRSTAPTDTCWRKSRRAWGTLGLVQEDGGAVGGAQVLGGAQVVVVGVRIRTAATASGEPADRGQGAQSASVVAGSRCRRGSPRRRR